MRYEDQYKNSLAKAQAVEPLTEFGDSVSLRDGTVSFRNVDIELPGTGPTIRLVRSAVIQDGQGGTLTTRNRIGQWELEIPRIQTVTALPEPFLRAAPVSPDAPNGWQVPGTDKNARCSNIGVPADVEYPQLPGTFYASEWWAGYQLIDGEGNQQPLMIRDPSLPNSADLGTMDHWVITCLPQTANPAEAPGEAFLATAPDGTRYWFDYLAYDAYPTLNKDFPEQPPKGYTYTYGLPRQHASMYVTRVQDRFGNSLTYNYTGGLLTSIHGSDGRHVEITRGTGVTITVGTAPDTRTWTYQTDAPGYSLVVNRPDGSNWKYAGDFARISFSSYSFANCDQDYAYEPTETRQVAVTAPSGATATYDFQRKTFGRAYAPKYCHQNYFPGGITSFEEVSSTVLARLWTGFALTSKVVTGPGLPSMTWTYGYSAANGCWDPAVTVYLVTGSAACTGSSPTTVWTDRTAPDGSRVRSTFSNRYDQTENKLLSEEVYAAGGALLRTTAYTYATTPSTGTNPFAFPLKPGLTFNVNANFESEWRWTPLAKTQVTQQGRTFTWEVATSGCGSYSRCFDLLARPTRITRASGPDSRTEGTAYRDDAAQWVMGQVASVTCAVAAPASTACDGDVMSATTFDPVTSLPATVSSFGQLQSTMTYHADGTLATVTDGRNNITTLSNWMRGIPQSIQFADQSTRLAAVNGLGEIESVTDENGFTTSYGYDLMGRLNRITYPVGDSVAWNDTTLVFEPVATAEYGIGAGHWRQTVTTGNAVKASHYDAFWRPLLTREYDAANVAGTQRFQRFAYDHEGRTTFSAYPGTTDALTAGTWMEYDALGRPMSASQDSELGLLTTTTQYLAGFQTRVTNPRGHSTTTSYLAWDAPTTDFPTAIAQPEGAYTDIVRDAFGKPLSITRHDAGSSTSLVRYFVYDGYQQLCKTVEPESLATVMTHDAAGNLAWSASGQNLLSGAGCDAEAVPAGAWVKRTYDARNRLATLSFPDFNGSQSWSYTPDGLPASVTTWNEGGSSTVLNGYTYNKRRLPIAESQEQTNGQTIWYFGYGYTPNGQLAAIGYPNLTVTYSPNALGQPTQVVGTPTNAPAETYATGISYYPNGAMAGFTFGNGIVHTMTRNVRGLPEESKDTYGSTLFLDDIYDYDPNGNVAAITDGATGQAQRGNRTMAYDGLDRLTDVTSPMYGTTRTGTATTPPTA